MAPLSAPLLADTEWHSSSQAAARAGGQHRPGTMHGARGATAPVPDVRRRQAGLALACSTQGCQAGHALHPPGCFTTPAPTPPGATWSNRGNFGSTCTEPPLTSPGRLDMLLPPVGTSWPALQDCCACQAVLGVGPNSRACRAWNAVIALNSSTAPLLCAPRELAGRVGAGQGSSAAGGWPLVTQQGETGWMGRSSL